MRIPRTHGAAFLTLLVSMAAFASNSSGQSVKPPVRIEYAAPARCPSAQSFLGEIRHRTTRVEVVDSSGEPGDITVAITQVTNRFVGALQRLSPGGHVSTRSLEAGSCEEVASALALVVALALDPDADTSAIPAPAPSASQVAAVSASAAPPPAPTASASAVPAPARPPTPPAEREERHVPESGGARVAFWTGVHGTVDANTVAPGMTLHPALSLESSWLGGASRWDPTLRLSGYYAQREYDGEAGGAKLRWYGARLAMCAFPLRPWSMLQAVPCAELGAGALHAEGLVDQPKTSTQAWAELGLSARARLFLASWLAVDLEAGPVTPLTRHTLEFRENGETLYRIPSLGGRFALGASVRIP